MPSAEKILELPDIAEAARDPAAATVARFEIRYSRFLDPKGKAVRPLPEFAADRAELVALYRAMVLARIFDAKAVALQRTGRLGTFPSALGQEAVAVGIAAALRAAVARGQPGRAVLVLGRRRAGQRFCQGAGGLSDLRAGRDPHAARCRCGSRLQAQASATGRGLCVWRRRNLEG